MDIGLFGNFDDDGQMSMFAFEEPEFDMESELAARTAALEKERAEKESGNGAKKNMDASEPRKAVARPRPKAVLPSETEVAEKQPVEVKVSDVVKVSDAGSSVAASKMVAEPTSNIRILRCSTCGKLLFVKEEAGGYTAFCNNCEIGYFQA